MYYPFILDKARKCSKKISRESKQLRKEPWTWKELAQTMNCLKWKKFCEKIEEVVMHLVKEFYANIGGRLDDKVFVLDVSSVVINNLIGALEHEEDDYLGTNGGRIRHK